MRFPTPITKTRNAWRLFRPLIHPYRRLLYVLSALNIVAGFTEAALLVFMARLGVAAANKSEEQGVAWNADIFGVHVTVTVAQVIIGAFILAALRVGLQVLIAWISAKLARRATSTLRRKTFSIFVGAPWSVQSMEKDGHLQELMSTYTTASANSVSIASQGLGAAAGFVTLLGSAIVLNWIAAGTIILILVGLGIGLRPLTRIGRNYMTRQAASGLKVSNTIAQSAGMAQEIKVFNVGSAVETKLDEYIEDVEHFAVRTAFIRKLLPAVYQGAAVMLAVGGLGVLYMNGSETLSSLGAVVLIFIRTSSYGQQLQTVYHQANEVVPYISALNAAMERYEEAGRQEGRAGGTPLDRLDQLEFRQVGFSYVADREALVDVSVLVERGESIGIVGPSGAGKSTFVQLLLRLRQPTAGHFLVNGVDASDYSIADWYRQVTFVPQESRLIDGTVRDNLRFYRDLVDEDLEQAAELAQIHDEIMGWPQGYDTAVGSRGLAVSGGQRQRICLARALATRPTLLILDEPTSSLDVGSESRIKEALQAMRGEVTLFIVAHRLSTLDICDRLMVFGHGRLEACDSTRELHASNEYYRDAVRLSTL